jgi:hypothetical protein
MYSLPDTSTLPRQRSTSIALWSAQALIAFSFGAAAVMKLVMPIQALAAIWPWAGELPSSLVRLLGVVDLCGGLGILLPSLLNIKPRLTAWAACGCIALQLCAMGFHASRGELKAVPVNLIFLALSALVLWAQLTSASAAE